MRCVRGSIPPQRNAQVAQSQLHIAEQDVDNTVVRAPFSGVVIAKAAQPGEIVSPLSAGGGFTRTGIGTIVDMDSLEVEVDVGEAFIGRVQPRMPVEATLNAYPGLEDPRRGDRHHSGRRPRQGHGQGAHRDQGARPSRRARHGSARELPRASAPRRSRAAPPGVLAPAAAIVSRDGNTGCLRRERRRRSRNVRVKLGRTLGDDREVLEGLGGGDTVVLDPPDELADGARVRVAGPGRLTTTEGQDWPALIEV